MKIDKDEKYNELTYGGLVRRIADGIPLTSHQKKTMEKCGLTIDDFIHPKSTADKVAIIEAERMNGMMGLS